MALAADRRRAPGGAGGVDHRGGAGVDCAAVRDVRDVDEVIVLATPAESLLARFDTALLLPNSFHAASTVARAGVPERWGYRTDWRSLLLTRAVPRARPPPDRLVPSTSCARSAFPNGPAAAASTARRCARRRGAPGRRMGWARAARRACARRRVRRGEALAAARVRAIWPRASPPTALPVLVGARPIARTAAACRGGSRPLALVDLVGQTDVPTLAGVLANCRALVTNDSGAMHLAAALGVGVTAMFGPTDERLTAPRIGDQGPRTGTRDHGPS